MRAIHTVLLGGLLCLPGTVHAQDNPFDVPGGQGIDPDAAEVPASDESTPLFEKAMELWRKGKWKSAQKAGRAILKKYPDSCHRGDIDIYFGDNAYLGCEYLHQSGPSSRRIDVAVMGDGFINTSKSQKRLLKWADDCLDVLYSEKSFEEYRDYFNYYHVRLLSKDEYVDLALTDEQKAKLEKKNKKKSKKNKKKWDFDTALGCRQAGGQGQVMSDRKLVYKWLGIADRHVPGAGDDGLVIVFAQFGKLGMGGGGIANCGKPSESVTVHEFGHAFVGLLDEYANNPRAPRRPIRAPNATTDPENPPWQHFLDAKVKGVGVHEGGATFKKGVWRPANGCAMNSAGNSGGYCPVCRETSVLRIYSYVSPIDASSPDVHTEINVAHGDEEKKISVIPMQPRGHDLTVTWLVETVDGDGGPPEKPEQPSQYGNHSGVRRYTGGKRRLDDERAAELEKPPVGDPTRLAKVIKGKRGRKKTPPIPTRHVFPVGKLDPGRYKITVVVKDETKWVLKDDKHLLEDRLTWWVTVRDRL
jgi:IgA peptidase M64